MIVVDSSALCAVFFNEPEKSAFQAILDGDERCIVSAVNAHETACVLRSKLGQAAVVEFWQWLTDNRIEIVRDDSTTVRLWWATKSEWDGLLDVAGLEVEALYGGFEREPFTDESLEIVYVARRP